METFTKQPGEKYPITMNFSPNLASGETISSQTTKAYDGITEVTSTVIHESSIVGTTVRALVKAGTKGKDYKITFQITTSNSNIYEEDLMMEVRED